MSCEPLVRDMFVLAIIAVVFSGIAGYILGRDL